jgi:hypothetical protein
VLSARAEGAPLRPWRPAGAAQPGATTEMQDIQARLKARETPQARFCWHCSKALPARAETCPFCGERQSRA